jgi:hypothetical protein
MDENNNDQRTASACTPPLRLWCGIGLIGTGFLLCRAHSVSKIMLFKAIEIRLMSILPTTPRRRYCPNRQLGEPNLMVGGAAEEQTIGHALVGCQLDHAAVSVPVVARSKMTPRIGDL